MKEKKESIFESRSQYLDEVKIPDSLGNRILPFAGVGISLLLWYLLTHLVGGTIISMMTPEKTFSALISLLGSQEFYIHHVIKSLYRFAIALFLCISIGLPVGLLIGYFQTADRLSSVTFQFLRVTSPIAWFPIAIAFLGTGDPSAVFVIFMAGVWPVIFNTAHGIKTINADWLKVGKSLGGNTRKMIYKVIMPGILPDFLNGARLSMGIGWIILVPAEMIGVSGGIGYYLLDARDRFAYDQVVATILIIGFIGYMLDLFLRKLYKRSNWQ